MDKDSLYFLRYFNFIKIFIYKILNLKYNLLEKKKGLIKE